MVLEKQYEAAAPHLINIARRDPNDVSNHVNLGSGYQLQGRMQDGIRELQLAVTLTDHRELSDQERRFRSAALLNLGSTFLSAGDYRNALMNFRQLDQTDPAAVDQMLESYKRSIAANPTEGIFENVALLLWAEGKSAEASSMLQALIDKHPDLNNLRGLLAFLNTSSLAAGIMGDRLVPLPLHDLNLVRYRGKAPDSQPPRRPGL
jgi:tetratricopeptide (TPR) repeat protein